ncbi:hypothetical protein D3C78_953720 [compost metagenome]
MLCHNGTRIGTAHHSVERNACFRFPFYQHPVQRRAATVMRQQRTVQVERPHRGTIQDFIAQQVAIIERKNHVRLCRFNAVNPQRMVHIVGCINGNTMLRRDASH